MCLVWICNDVLMSPRHHLHHQQQHQQHYVEPDHRVSSLPLMTYIVTPSSGVIQCIVYWFISLSANGCSDICSPNVHMQLATIRFILKQVTTTPILAFSIVLCTLSIPSRNFSLKFITATSVDKVLNTHYQPPLPILSQPPSHPSPLTHPHPPSRISG